MLKLRRAIPAALAMMLAVLMLSAPAMAVVDGLGYIYLTTDGGDDLVGTDWKFYVETPPAIGLDEDYWNFTVYADPVNSSATNATYYVNIYLDNGEANVTKNCTIAAKNDVRVYSNASFAAADWAAMTTANTSSMTYINLCNATIVLDNYSSGISIYEYSYVATIVVLLYAIIPIMILMVVLNYMQKGVKRK